MPLSDFDTAFQETALPALYATMGAAYDYKPSKDEAVSKEDVLVIPDEQEVDFGTPVPGKGQMSGMRRVWRCQTAQLTPATNGVFVASDGSYRVDQKPREDNGEWVFGVVKIA